MVDLLGGPGVEVDGLDAGDVDAHSAVVSGAADADEESEVGRGPAGVVALAVGAELVARLADEVLEDGEVPLRRRAVLRVALAHRGRPVGRTRRELGLKLECEGEGEGGGGRRRRGDSEGGTPTATTRLQ